MFEFGFWSDSYCVQKEIWKPLAYLENYQTMFAVWKGLGCWKHAPRDFDRWMVFLFEFVAFVFLK